MEGDVEAILPRPTLPSPSNPSSGDSKASESEIKGEMDKWDAWHACAGLSRTEAKRRYIEVLIQTMKVYAVGTAEARELVSELEFVWDQIRGQQQSHSGSEGRKRRRGESGGGKDGGEEEGGGRLRVLSPVSRGGSGEIVEGEDASIPEPTSSPSSGDDDDEFETTSQNPQDRRRRRRRRKQTQTTTSGGAGSRKWRTSIETALTTITTELAALREQLDQLNHHHPSSSPFQRKAGWAKNTLALLRWLLYIAIRQLATDAVILLGLLLWGVWRGDGRVEGWVRRRWVEVRSVLLRWKGRVEEGRGIWWWWRVLVGRLVPGRLMS